MDSQRSSKASYVGSNPAGCTRKFGECMNKRKNVILRAVENQIFDETLRKRVNPSLSADFEYFPGEVVVLLMM